MVKSRQAASMLLLARKFKQMTNQVKRGGSMGDELLCMDVKFEPDDSVSEGTTKVLLSAKDAERINTNDQMNAELVKHLEQLGGEVQGIETKLEKGSNFAVGAALVEMVGLGYGLYDNLKSKGSTMTGKKILSRLLWSDEHTIRLQDKWMKSAMTILLEKSENLKDLVNTAQDEESKSV